MSRKKPNNENIIAIKHKRIIIRIIFTIFGVMHLKPKKELVSILFRQFISLTIFKYSIIYINRRSFEFLIVDIVRTWSWRVYVAERKERIYRKVRNAKSSSYLEPA